MRAGWGGGSGETLCLPGPPGKHLLWIACPSTVKKGHHFYPMCSSCWNYSKHSLIILFLGTLFDPIGKHDLIKEEAPIITYESLIPQKHGDHRSRSTWFRLPLSLEHSRRNRTGGNSMFHHLNSTALQGLSHVLSIS